MIWLLHTLLVLLVALLQVSFLPTLLGHWPAPNLIFGAAVGLVLHRATAPALLWALLGGLILDSTLPGRGLYLLTLTLLVLGLDWLLHHWLPTLAVPALGSLIILSSAVLPTLELVLAGEFWSLRWLTALAANALGLFLAWLAARRFLSPAHTLLSPLA